MNLCSERLNGEFPVYLNGPLVILGYAFSPEVFAKIITYKRGTVWWTDGATTVSVAWGLAEGAFELMASKGTSALTAGQHFAHKVAAVIFVELGITADTYIVAQEGAILNKDLTIDNSNMTYIVDTSVGAGKIRHSMRRLRVDCPTTV